MTQSFWSTGYSSYDSRAAYATHGCVRWIVRHMDVARRNPSRLLCGAFATSPFLCFCSPKSVDPVSASTSDPSLFSPNVRDTRQSTSTTFSSLLRIVRSIPQVYSPYLPDSALALCLHEAENQCINRFVKMAQQLRPVKCGRQHHLQPDGSQRLRFLSPDFTTDVK